MPNPYVIIALLIAWGASVTGSFFYGQHVEFVEAEASVKKDIQDAIAEANVKSKSDFELVLKVEKEKQEARLEEARRNVKVIKEIKTNTIYSSAECNMPPSGLQLWNEAGAGKTDTTKLDAGVPK